ncbi:MAG: hypothetical protein SFZ03_00310 [Candidatus Melainabacteria bacterium]|nr:hypothetical protein [Candidatus Melainabacteria bacterium]
MPGFFSSISGSGGFTVGPSPFVLTPNPANVLGGTSTFGNSGFGLPVAPASTPVTILQIDNFTPGQNGRSHGERIAAEMLNAASSVGANVTLQQVNTGNGAQDIDSFEQRITNALDSVILNAQQGIRPNAISIHVADYRNSPTTQRIQQQLDYIHNVLGIPVSTDAADDPTRQNLLGSTRAFLVENTDANGQRLADSGTGNLRGVGNDSSARLAPMLALYNAMGVPNDQILSLANENGGFLPPPPTPGATGNFLPGFNPAMGNSLIGPLNTNATQGLENLAAQAALASVTGNAFNSPAVLNNPNTFPAPSTGGLSNGWQQLLSQGAQMMINGLCALLFPQLHAQTLAAQNNPNAGGGLFLSA